MKDFLDWVFDIETDPVYSMLFVIGGFLVGFGLLVAALILHPLLGAAAFIALFFGVPYVAYRMGKKDD